MRWNCWHEYNYTSGKKYVDIQNSIFFPWIFSIEPYCWILKTIPFGCESWHMEFQPKTIPASTELESSIHTLQFRRRRFQALRKMDGRDERDEIGRGGLAKGVVVALSLSPVPTHPSVKPAAAIVQASNCTDACTALAMPPSAVPAGNLHYCIKTRSNNAAPLTL